MLYVFFRIGSNVANHFPANNESHAQRRVADMKACGYDAWYGSLPTAYKPETMVFRHRQAA